MQIEQAIFTSIRSTRNDGYQLACTSPGVTAEQKKELVKWGPAHDSLEDGRVTSVNVHPLEDGCICIGKTSLAGEEYSGRGGQRIYTQYLIVPPALMQRFANHPFRILEAVTASGRLQILDPLPRQLEPFRLVGRASLANTGLLALLTREIGSDRLATMVSAAISTMALGVVSPVPPERLFAATLDLLPPACRTEFPLTTGLRFSPRRAFRWLALPTCVEHRRRLERLNHLTVLDLTADVPTRFLPEYGWPLLIWELLKKSRFPEVSQVMKIASKTPSENFDEVAERLRDQLLRGERIDAEPTAARPSASARGTAGKDSDYRAARLTLRGDTER